MQAGSSNSIKGEILYLKYGIKYTGDKLAKQKVVKKKMTLSIEVKMLTVTSIKQC